MSARRLVLLVRWAVVAVPLAWGVWQTIRTSLPLFGWTPPG
jgi:hypothetical protein